MSSTGKSASFPWFWILTLSAFEFAALYSIKRAKEDEANRTAFLVLAALLYGAVVPYSLYRSLEYLDIGSVNFAWNVWSTIGAYLIGIYLFHDAKLTVTKAFGVILGLAGLGVVIFG